MKNFDTSAKTVFNCRVSLATGLLRLVHTGLAVYAFVIFCASDGSQAAEPGSPGAVVDQYYKALSAAKSYSNLEKYESKRLAGEHRQMLLDIAPERKNQFVGYLRLGLPKTIVIGAEKADTDKARVLVKAVGSAPMEVPPKQQEGVSIPTQKFGAFFLVKEDGLWRIDEQSWDDSEGNLSQMINPNDWQKWMQEVGRLEFPQQPVKGKIEGQEFNPTEVTVGAGNFQGTWLRFRSADGAMALSLSLLDQAGSVEGKTFNILNDKMSWQKKKMFNVIAESPKLENPRTRAGVAVSAMKLRFGQATDKGIPGEILLRMADQPETSLAGTFVAVKK